MHRMMHWLLNRLLLHWMVNWLLHLRVHLLRHRLMHGLLHWLGLIVRSDDRLWLYLRGVSGRLVAIKLSEAWLRVSNLRGRCRKSGLHKRLRLGWRLRI